MNKKIISLTLALIFLFLSCAFVSATESYAITDTDFEISPCAEMCLCGGKITPEAIFKFWPTRVYCTRTNTYEDGEGQTITYYYCDTCGDYYGKTETARKTYCSFLQRYFTGEHP